MKKMVSAVIATFLFAMLSPRVALAIGGMDVYHYYYSDPAMTQLIGWTHKTCWNRVERQGIYFGSTGWDAYLQSHFVYDRYEEQACDNNYYHLSCWIWYGSGGSSSSGGNYSSWVCA
jgi:hypothetical protein